MVLKANTDNESPIAGMRRGDKPHLLTSEPTTRLQTTITLLCKLLVPAVIFTLLQTDNGRLPWSVPGVLAFLLVICIVIRISIKNYVLLDLNEKTIQHHRFLFGFDLSQPKVSFKDFQSLAMFSKKGYNKHELWVEYNTEIILNSGKHIRLLEFGRDHEEMVERAKAAADVLKLPLAVTPIGHFAKTVVKPGQVEVVHYPDPQTEIKLFIVVILGMLGAFGYLLYS